MLGANVTGFTERREGRDTCPADSSASQSRDARPLAALCTPRGRGAVASIRLCGCCDLLDQPERELFFAANRLRLAEQPLGRIVFGHWGRQPREEVVLCRRDDGTTDIHCHGGDAAVRRILADLERAGCQIAPWQDLAAASAGLFASECLAALARAPTLQTANLLLEQNSGVLHDALAALRLCLEQTGPDIEAALPQLDRLLVWADFGLHLTIPWKVVIVGRPNVGKSSLLNALAGFARSIVFDQPGTTRDIVTAEIALRGWPVQLVDTAGLRDSSCALESAGIGLAREQIALADCRLIIVDTSQPPEPDDFELLTAWPKAIVVAHKADLVDVWGDRTPAGARRISSLTGSGVETLADAIAASLVPRVPDSGTPIPVARRQVELLQRAKAALESGAAAACRAAVQEILA
jgi:tRNA modification GTPase